MTLRPAKLCTSLGSLTTEKNSHGSVWFPKHFNEIIGALECFLSPGRPADNFFRSKKQFLCNMHFTGILGPRTLSWEKVFPRRRRLVLENIVC